MSRRRNRVGILALLVCAAAVALSAAPTFPPSQGYVSDFAGVLDGPTRAALESELRGVEQETTVEVAVVTVRSLDGMSVEEYANRLFAAWGIGKKRADNGVLILVAPSQREMRIEVGYGLEAILPDGLAGEIIRADFLPRFRAGDYPGGIRAGTARVIDVVRRQHRLTASERQAIAARSGDRPPAFASTVFFSVFIALGMLAVGAGLASKAIFPVVWGSLFGGIPFAMALLPFFNAAVPFLVFLAVAMFVFGYHRGRDPRWLAQLRKGSHGGGRAGGWVMGTTSSGGSGGGSGGGFGGGSSGGGGASGSW